jgi:hypothetical protein
MVYELVYLKTQVAKRYVSTRLLKMRRSCYVYNTEMPPY